jgi:hypothetical protein
MDRETERDERWSHGERGRDGGRRRCGEESEREEDRRGKRRGWMGKWSHIRKVEQGNTT